MFSSSYVLPGRWFSVQVKRLWFSDDVGDGMAGKIFESNGRFYVDIAMPDGKRFKKSCGRQMKTARAVLAMKRQEIDAFKAENMSGTFAACWSHYLHRMGKEGKPATVTTIEERRKHWAAFERRQVSGVTQLEIDAHIDNMKTVDGEKRSTGGKNGSIKAVRAALLRACDDGLIGKLPFRFKLRKHMEEIPVLVTQADFASLVSAIDGTTKSVIARSRLNAVMHIAFHAGLRHNEVLHLCLQDIDFSARIIRITAKEDFGFSPKSWEERKAPISRVLEQALKNQIALLPDWHHSVSEGSGFREWLFPRYKGNRAIPMPYEKTSSMRNVKKVFDAVGQEPGLHRLRGSFITRMLGAGADIGVVMRTAGHKNLEVVQRYVARDDDAALQAVDRMYPHSLPR